MLKIGKCKKQTWSCFYLMSAKHSDIKSQDIIKDTEMEEKKVQTQFAIT